MTAETDDLRSAIAVIVSDAQDWDNGTEAYVGRIMDAIATDRDRQAAEIAAKDAEIGRLRQIVSDCASAIGNGAFAKPECSLKFMERIPVEIAAVAKLLDAEIAELRALTTWRPTHRHVKRGSEYMIVGAAELQASTDDLVDGSEMIVYRGKDGRIWCRQVDEFNDGRFEVLPPSDTMSGEA